MSSLTILYIVILLIYFSECLVVVPDDTVVIRVTERGGHPTNPIFKFDGLRKKVFLGPLLPTYGGIALCMADSHTGKESNPKYVLDTRNVARLWHLYRRHAGLIYFEVQIQGLLLFVFAPLIGIGIAPIALVWWLPFWLGLQIHIIYLYAKLSGHPLFMSKSRGEDLALLILSPPLALRARDLLIRRLFAKYHWLAVATVLCDTETAFSMTAGYLRQLKYPATWELDEHQFSDPERLKWKEAIEMFVQTRYGITELGPPAELNPTAEKYCPHCCEGFIASSATCSDCGIELINVDTDSPTRRVTAVSPADT
jgi:hypothetical protein